MKNLYDFSFPSTSSSLFVRLFVVVLFWVLVSSGLFAFAFVLFWFGVLGGGGWGRGGGGVVVVFGW